MPHQHPHDDGRAEQALVDAEVDATNRRHRLATVHAGHARRNRTYAAASVVVTSAEKYLAHLRQFLDGQHHDEVSRASSDGASSD